MRHHEARAGRPPRALALAILCTFGFLGVLNGTQAVAEEWLSGDPAAHVTDPAALSTAARTIGAMPGVYAVLVAHRGELIVEEYFRRGTRDKPHNMKSASKSLLSALVGIAVGEGLIDLDRPLVEILPQARDLDDPAKNRITVRHLLTMTSGLEPTSYETYGRWITESDWVRAALELPLVAEPGTLFQYSTGNTHLLSAVLTTATGTSTLDYAEERLLDPMEIEITGWQRDPQGIYVGGNNLSMTPRDMAKFGQLFLDRGRWGARQLVPPEWVDESIRNGDRGLHPVYGTYGYLWWTDLLYEQAFTGVGFGGQYIYVSPQHEAVVVVTATLFSKGEDWTAELFDVLRNELLPELAPSTGPSVMASAPASQDLAVPPATELSTATARLARDPALESLEHAVERARLELAALAGAPLPAEEESLPATGRTTSRVNLRQGPGEKHPRVAFLQRGIPLAISERSGEWLRARANGDQGWLHQDYVELDGTSWRRVASELRQKLAEFSQTAGRYLPPPAAVAAPGRVEQEPADTITTTAPAESSEPESASGTEAALDSAGAAELVELRAAVADLTLERDQLASSLAEEEEQRHALERRLEESEDSATRAETLAEELAGETKRRAQLEESHDRSTAASQSARRDVETVRAERDALEGDVLDLRTRLAALESDSSAATVTRTELEGRLATLDGELETRRTALEDERSQRESLVAELETAREKIAELSANLAASSALSQTLDETRTERDGLVAELAQERERIARLEEEMQAISVARAVPEEPTAAPREPPTPTDELDQARDRLRQRDTELDLASQRFTELEGTLAEERRQRSGAEARLAEVEKADRAKSQALIEAEQERDRLAAERDAARDRLAELLQLLETAGEDRATGKMTIDELEASAEIFVYKWAQDWSSRDPERYLANYASSFEAPAGSSRRVWQGRRRRQLEEAAFVSVQVTDLRVLSIEGGIARIRFHETYRTDRNSVATVKELELVPEAGRWRILRELFLSSERPRTQSP